MTDYNEELKKVLEEKVIIRELEKQRLERKKTVIKCYKRKGMKEMKEKQERI